MKRWLIALVLVTVSLASQAQPTTADRRWVLDTLKRYSPEGHDIVVSFQEAFPDEGDFMDWYDGESEKSRWQSLVTIVHELSHGYMQGFAKKGSLFYPVGLKKGVEVPLTKVYRTRLMASTFPESLRTGNFWYVDNEDEALGSQAWGAYGLLDEMAAYYQGAKFPLEALAAFRSNTGDADWKTWFEVMNSTVAGAAEFRLFILKYLQYAEKKYPDVAKGIYGNAGFREAFRKLDQRAYEFYVAAMAVEAELYAELMANGHKIRVEEGICVISKFRKPSFVGMHFNSYEVVRSEMAKREYQAVLAKLYDGAAPPAYPEAATDALVASLNAGAAAAGDKLPPPGAANGKIVWQPSLAAAVARAEKDYRLIIVQVSTPAALKNGGKAIRAAFEDPTVIAALAPFVCLKVNLDDSGDGAYFKATYEMPSDLPAFFILDCAKRLVSAELLSDSFYGPELAIHQIKAQLAFYGDRNGLAMEHMIKTDVGWAANLDQALLSAKKNGRKVLAYFYMNTAKEVIALTEEVFADPEVAAYLNTNYVSVKIEIPPSDTDRTANDVVEDYEVWGVPRVLVMDWRKNVSADKPLYCGYDDMVQFIKESN